MSDEDRERESELRQYYEGRIRHVLQQLKIANAQLLKLHSMYKESVELCNKCATEKDVASKELQQLQEQLSHSKVIELFVKC